MSDQVVFTTEFITNDQSIRENDEIIFDIGDNESIIFDAEFGAINQSIFDGNTPPVETGDYNLLENLPIINEVTVRGNKVSNDYKLQDQMAPITESEIDKIIFGEGGVI